jgi:tRNA modification GTPase
MNPPPTEADTFIACLTPPGAAAIATLAVHGPRAWEVTRELFRPLGDLQTSLPAAPPPDRFWLGRLGEEVADQVVVRVKRVTPIPWVEIHCHGGAEVIRLFLETYQAYGIRPCSWQRLEHLAAADPTRAEAAVVVKAQTTRTAAILLDQYHGAFSQAVKAIRTALDRADLDEALRRLNDLARLSPVGRHLTAPWRVAVLGAPNVGKSSLVNALAGFHRSVVAETPGTTRDVVTTLIAVDGWPVEVADTAGFRQDGGTLEEQGMAQACATAAAADLCLWVLDAAALPVWPPFRLTTMRPVINKVDLPAAWDVGEAAGALSVSARTRAGLAELCQALAGWLVPDPPSPGEAVPFTPELCRRVEEARHFCLAGQVEEARQAIKALTEEAG